METGLLISWLVHLQNLPSFRASHSLMSSIITIHFREYPFMITSLCISTRKKESFKLFTKILSCCLSRRFDSLYRDSWISLSILSTFTLNIVLLCHQFYLVSFQNTLEALQPHIYEYINSIILFTHKTMMLLKKVTTLLLMICYLSKMQPLMEKNVGFHCLLALSHLFSSDYIFCDYVFIIFCWLCYWNFLYWQFCLLLILYESEFCNKQWSFGRWYYCSSPVVYKKFFSYKSEVNCIFQNDTKLAPCVYLGRFKNYI